MDGGVLLTIIIPVYNAQEYLCGCLDNILAAQLPDTQVLLVDDGSIDGSPDICARYARQHDSITLLRQENAGPSVARNRGLELAQGEYVAFFDGDDLILPQVLHRAVLRLRQYPGADLWVSDFHRIADNGCVLDRVYQIEPTSEPILDAEYLTRFLGEKDCVWNVWRYFFRREFLLKHGLRFPEGIHCAEDLEFVVRALTRVERPAFFHEPYYLYRVNYGNTLTRRYTLKRVQDTMDMLTLAGEHLAHAPGAAARHLRGKLAREYFLNLSLYGELNAADRKAAAQAMAAAAILLRRADALKYRALGLAVRRAGVPLTGLCLLALKRCKRALRAAKVRAHQAK